MITRYVKVSGNLLQLGFLAILRISKTCCSSEPIIVGHNLQDKLTYLLPLPITDDTFLPL